MAYNYTPYSGEYSGTQIDSILAKADASESYTSAEKTKLASLENYDDSEVRNDISYLETALDDKEDKHPTVEFVPITTSELKNATVTKNTTVSGYNTSTYVPKTITANNYKVIDFGVKAGAVYKWRVPSLSEVTNINRYIIIFGI